MIGREIIAGVAALGAEMNFDIYQVDASELEEEVKKYAHAHTQRICAEANFGIRRPLACRLAP